MDLELLLFWAQAGVGAVTVLVLVWFVLIPFGRALVHPIGAWSEVANPWEQRAVQQVEPLGFKRPSGTQILEEAKKDPVKTAHLIQNWLKEGHKVE